jgi:hypothetical protein
LTYEDIGKIFDRATEMKSIRVIIPKNPKEDVSGASYVNEEEKRKLFKKIIQAVKGGLI